MRLEPEKTCLSHRRERPRQVFRNPCHSRFHSHPLQSQPLPGIRLTCFEGPFGEVLRESGPMAKANPLRFSTKFQDDESGMLYYGYRYYNPSTGRWVSRDPIDEVAFQSTATENTSPSEDGERGEGNPYCFVGNSAIFYWDAHGLKCACNILLEVSPPPLKAVRKNVLNVAVGNGHTWLILTHEGGATKTFSFGPATALGKENRDIFLKGQVPGNANYTTQGDVVRASQRWNLNEAECAVADKLIDGLKRAVPNYTPTYQCTSAALQLLNAIPVRPAPPSGKGPVIARAYRKTYWSGTVENPYHLATQLGWTGAGGGDGPTKKDW